MLVVHQKQKNTDDSLLLPPKSVGLSGSLGAVLLLLLLACRALSKADDDNAAVAGLVEGPASELDRGTAEVDLLSHGFGLGGSDDIVSIFV